MSTKSLKKLTADAVEKIGKEIAITERAELQAAVRFAQKEVEILDHYARGGQLLDPGPPDIRDFLLALLRLQNAEMKLRLLDLGEQV
jgi:hypothetical protein